jgi:hypothetical protein
MSPEFSGRLVRAPLAEALGAAVCALLALGASGLSAQVAQPHPPAQTQTEAFPRVQAPAQTSTQAPNQARSWHGEVGFGGYSFDGERAWAVEAGALRHEADNRSLAVGARLLLAPEPLVCVGLGPCPDGALRLTAVGVHLERRFHLGAAQGATPAPSWLAPRVALTMGGGGPPVAEVGGALGQELRLGGSAGLWLSARGGIAVARGAARSRESVRTAGVFGLVGGLRWEF